MPDFTSRLSEVDLRDRFLLLKVKKRHNSQSTVIVALASSNPRQLFTLQMYTCPLSLLLSFVSLRVSDVDRTLRSPSFVHVMSGFGLPLALQNKFKLFPSTTFSSDCAVTISGGTKRKQKRTNQNTYKYHKHSKGYKNCNLSMTTQLSMNE